MITADRWYDQQPDLTLYYQGDVIRDIPFPTFPPTLPVTREEVWPILRPMQLKGRTVEQAMARLPNALVGRAARDVEDVWTLPIGEWAAVHFRPGTRYAADVISPLHSSTERYRQISRTDKTSTQF